MVDPMSVIRKHLNRQAAIGTESERAEAEKDPLYKEFVRSRDSVEELRKEKLDPRYRKLRQEMGLIEPPDLPQETYADRLIMEMDRLPMDRGELILSVPYKALESTVRETLEINKSNLLEAMHKSGRGRDEKNMEILVRNISIMLANSLQKYIIILAQKVPVRGLGVHSAQVNSGVSLTVRGLPSVRDTADKLNQKGGQGDIKPLLDLFEGLLGVNGIAKGSKASLRLRSFLQDEVTKYLKGIYGDHYSDIPF